MTLHRWVKAQFIHQVGDYDMRIDDLAYALNQASPEFQIGGLQDMRVRLRSLSRRPGQAIFNRQTIHENYAFHVGGRTELQFNIGKERDGGVDMIRHGVAFSLELSQTLPTIDPLVEKIKLFNDYVHSHPEDFGEFQMWYHWNGERSEYGPVNPIADELIVPGPFIMLGRVVPLAKVDVADILADFDRLLPLYAYVENDSRTMVVSTPPTFKPGCPKFAESTSATISGRTVDIALRHKQLQPLLHNVLCQEAGRDNVATEHALDLGGRVDLAVRNGDNMTFYELKIAPTVQSCLRAALGQLLEYAYWPSANRANELIVVGEAKVGSGDRAYLRLLRERFALPLWYRRIDVDRNLLEEKS